MIVFSNKNFNFIKNYTPETTWETWTTQNFSELPRKFTTGFLIEILKNKKYNGWVITDIGFTIIINNICVFSFLSALRRVSTSLHTLRVVFFLKKKVLFANKNVFVRIIESFSPASFWLVQTWLGWCYDIFFMWAWLTVPEKKGGQSIKANVVRLLNAQHGRKFHQNQFTPEKNR